MSLLNDGRIAGIVSKALGSSRVLGEAGTLHIREPGLDLDGNASGLWTEYPVTITPTDYSQFRRDSGAIPAHHTRTIIYRAGLIPTVRAGDRVTVRGELREIVAAMADPAGATWDCETRRVQ